jgi:hypothetical protein
MFQNVPDGFCRATLTNHPVPRNCQRSIVVFRAREDGFNIASVMQYPHNEDTVRRRLVVDNFVNSITALHLRADCFHDLDGGERARAEQQPSEFPRELDNAVTHTTISSV